MTKEDFIKKYIYGVNNDALTDKQEAIDMSKDLDRYFIEHSKECNNTNLNLEVEGTCTTELKRCPNCKNIALVEYIDGYQCSFCNYSV